MEYQWMRSLKVVPNISAKVFSTMRVGALDADTLKAKVDSYLNSDFVLATDEEVIAERGTTALDAPSAEEQEAQAEQEVNNGNTSAEAIAANDEVADAGENAEEASTEDAPAEAPVEEEAAPAEEAAEAPAEEVEEVEEVEEAV